MGVPGLFWEVWHICVNIPKISQCLHLFWDKLNIHITGMLHRVSDKLTHRINYSRTAIETNPVGKWNKCNLQLVPEDIGVGIVGDICIGTRGQGLLAMIICVTNCNLQSYPVHHYHQHYNIIYIPIKQIKIYLFSFRSWPFWRWNNDHDHDCHPRHNEVDGCKPLFYLKKKMTRWLVANFFFFF